MSIIIDYFLRYREKQFSPSLRVSEILREGTNISLPAYKLTANPEDRQIERQLTRQRD